MRFWITRSGPFGAGMRRNRVAVIVRNVSSSFTARVNRNRSRGVEYPSSSRPLADAKCVSVIPSRRACTFMCRTKAASDPSSAIASATAASLALPSSIA